MRADSAESARNIYEFFVQLFTANWAKLVCLQPRRDLERRQAARAAAPPAPGPPPASLSDAEVEALLEGLFDAEGPAGAKNGGPGGGPGGGRAPGGAASQNLVLGEADGEDVEDYEEDPLQHDPP